MIAKLRRARPWRYGFALVLFIIFAASLLAPSLAPYDPLRQDLTRMLQAPSARNWFGTDELGRDIFSRVLYGGRMSLMLAGLCTLAAGAVALFFGILSAVGRPWVDVVIGRVADVQLAMPTMVIAIVLLTFAGNSLVILALVMAVSSWVTSYRILRAQAQVIMVQSYIDAARLAGAGWFEITKRHLLPGILPIAVVTMTLNGAAILIALSGLNYLGLGLQPPTPDWGGMVASGQSRLSNAPWISAFPGLVLVLTIISIQSIGDTVSDWLVGFGQVEEGER